MKSTMSCSCAIDVFKLFLACLWVCQFFCHVCVRKINTDFCHVSIFFSHFYDMITGFCYLRTFTDERVVGCFMKTLHEKIILMQFSKTNLEILGCWQRLNISYLITYCILYIRAFQLKSTAGRTPISQVIRRAARNKIKGVK